MVYVDNFKAKYRRMLMSHMIADTQTELYEMVDKIGVQRKWIQDYGTAREHFDICQTKRKLAVEYGAKKITMKELVKITSNRTHEKNT